MIELAFSLAEIIDISQAIGIFAVGISIGALIGVCLIPMDRYQ